MKYVAEIAGAVVLISLLGYLLMAYAINAVGESLQ